MTYTTKFKLGDTVYFMENNKICSQIIEALSIEHDLMPAEHLHRESAPHVKYRFRVYNEKGLFLGWKTTSESLVFGIKEELLASL